MREQVAYFWKSQTVRLTTIYLAIIMLMSLAFTSVLYVVSAGHIDRQVPDEVVEDDAGSFGTSPRIVRYIKQQSQQSKADLIFQLTLFNLLIFIFGAALSYILARWTLDPIEKNVAAQSRFVSDASHELRTPLTTIQTTNEVALRRASLSAKDAKKIIEENLSDVQRLQRMIEKLMQLVTNDMSLQIAPIQISEVVDRSLLDVSGVAFDKKIKIDASVSNYIVDADPESASQALTVLLDNAIKYSNAGSTVKVVTRKRRRSQAIIDVIDNGPGITKQDQKKIFDRFYRTDAARTHDSHGGFGLGLGIAQRIAVAHGGNIEVSSTLKSGSRFSLVLPVHKKTDPNA